MQQQPADDFAFVITTYDRPDDARCLIELLRLQFGDTPIVHAYNGRRDTWKPHGENDLLQRANLGHHAGAGDLIDSGIQWCRKQQIRFAVHLHPDTWLGNRQWVEQLLIEMRDDGHVLAGTVRPDNSPGLCTDLFVADVDQCIDLGVFPLDFAVRERRHHCSGGSEVPRLEPHFLERARSVPGPMFRPISERVLRSDNGVVERDVWEHIRLTTTHDPLQKQEFVKALCRDGYIDPSVMAEGSSLKRLLDSDSLSWFNDIGTAAVERRVRRELRNYHRAAPIGLELGLEPGTGAPDGRLP